MMIQVASTPNSFLNMPKKCCEEAKDNAHYVRYELTSVFGGDMQNCISPIFAFSTLLGPFTFADFCVNTSPSTNSVSSTVPPSFLMTLISCEVHKNCK
jgi:hypothetical protein